MGRELTLAILARGDRVIASARSNATVLSDLQINYPDTFSFLQLDITETFEEIVTKAKEAVAVWGRIDVLVNNAGYSMVGTVEEARLVYFTNVVRLGSLIYTAAFIGSTVSWRCTRPTYMEVSTSQMRSFHT